MRKILTLTIIITICFNLVGCTNNSVKLDEESKFKVSDDLVSIIIKKGSLTKSKAILILKNHTDNDYVYGNTFSIEKEKDGTWYTLKLKEELNFTMIGYVLKANEEIEIEANWRDVYGNFTPGKYRIVKDIYLVSEETKTENIYIAAEFTI